MVTYDNCLTWNRLKQGEQFINFHSYSSYYFYDIPPLMTNAYGSLIGNGNLGDTLSFTNISTYFSKNVGKTIKEVYITNN
jgi:hypothetical protein